MNSDYTGGPPVVIGETRISRDGHIEMSIKNSDEWIEELSRTTQLKSVMAMMEMALCAKVLSLGTVPRMGKSECPGPVETCVIGKVDAGELRISLCCLCGWTVWIRFAI